MGGNWILIGGERGQGLVIAAGSVSKQNEQMFYNFGNF